MYTCVINLLRALSKLKVKSLIGFGRKAGHGQRKKKQVLPMLQGHLPGRAGAHVGIMIANIIPPAGGGTAEGRAMAEAPHKSAWPWFF